VPALRAFVAALLTAVLVPVLVGAQPAPAHADPVPGMNQPWPRCGTGTDTDGKYCIVSVTRDGNPVGLDPNCGVPGDYETPYVDLLDPGTVRYGVLHTPVDGSGCGGSDGDVDPTIPWKFKVNVGSIHPRELYGQIRNVDLAFGGDAASGFTFTLTFHPTPIAWRSDFSSCTTAGCGTDTTVADLVYRGFVTGYVTDLASSGLPAAEIADRVGMVNAYNAQAVDGPWYDFDTNTLVLKLANPHLRAPGTPAVGYFESFLPNAYLVNQLHVPYPDTLTGGSFTVVRAGSTSSVPFTVSHEPDGIRLVIHDITFSTPTYKIRPKPSAPGQPRWGSATRIAPHAVRLRFRAPIANGGKPVTSYVGSPGRARSPSQAGVVPGARRQRDRRRPLEPAPLRLTCSFGSRDELSGGFQDRPSLVEGSDLGVHRLLHRASEEEPLQPADLGGQTEGHFGPVADDLEPELAGRPHRSRDHLEGIALERFVRRDLEVGGDAPAHRARDGLMYDGTGFGPAMGVDVLHLAAPGRIVGGRGEEREHLVDRTVDNDRSRRTRHASMLHPFAVALRRTEHAPDAGGVTQVTCGALDDCWGWCGQ
jgi:hypothetical protein